MMTIENLKKVLAVAVAAGAGALSADAAIFLETNGRVVIEAEHFDSRQNDPDDQHHWHVVPDDDEKPEFNGVIGSPIYEGARAGKYIQSLPDSDQNQNAFGDHDLPPTADYKVKITTPGDYRLWLRWGGHDGSSDSIYATVREVGFPFWYRYARQTGPRFEWHGMAAPDSNSASGGDVEAVFVGLTAGTYTIRIGQREDGSAVDAIILQLANLPAPTGLGPAESRTEGDVIPVPELQITKQPANTLGPIMGSATFTVEANVVPETAQWFRNGVEIPGATGLTFSTSALTEADNGAKYKVVLGNSAGTVESLEATVTVVPVEIKTGVALAEVYRGIGGTAISGLTNNPAYPSSPTTAVEVKFLEYPAGPDDGTAPRADVFNNYGVRISGFITPKETGNYVFYIAADDNANFFLSTDSSPANKRLLAWEPQWNPVRDFSGVARRPGCDAGDCENISTPIPLQANQRYYFEALMKEGGGGDNLAVAWRKEGELPPDQTSLPIGSEFLSYAIPQVIKFSGLEMGFKEFSFGVADVGTSLVDTASAKLTLNGQQVPLTFTAENGVTTFRYVYPARLEPGSTHTFNFEVADKGGVKLSNSGTFTLPMPWLPPEELKGPAVVDKAWAIRHIFGTGGQIGNIPAALQAIAAAGTPEFTGAFVDTTSPVINFGNGGRFGDGLPYPDQVFTHPSGLWTGDDFVQLSIGHIVVPEAGLYTFGVHSDDGFALRIRGGEVVSVNGNGQADPADPQTVVHPANTGDSNTRAVYNLKKGIYRVEFFWWERGGGDNGELYMARGAHSSDASTGEWKLVGDPTPTQEFTGLGVDSNGWTVISSDPGGDPLSFWWEAEIDLAATGGNPQNYDVLNVGDPDTNPGTLPFPKNTDADDNDFALKATATLVVPRDGLWVLGFNSDDGAYLKIAGQSFIEILQNNTGASYNEGERVVCDCLTGNSGTTMTINLAKGNYPIEVGMFERGGGAFLQARGAQAGSPLLPLLAKDGTGQFEIRQALQLTDQPPKVEETQQPTISINQSGGTITINFTGRLQQSDDPAGTFTDVPDAASPFTVNASGAAKFFRTAQ